MSDMNSSSSTGPHAPTSDESYPQIFLLAIFIPCLALGALIFYFNMSVRHHGRIKCPPYCFERRRRATTPSNRLTDQPGESLLANSAVSESQYDIL